MPYAHKTSQPSKNALRRGNLAFAIDGEQNLGPTSATGYYNTLHPPTGGYAIYSLGLNNNPIVMIADTDEELIRAANTLGGSVTTKNDALSYLAGNASTWILHNIPNNIVTDNLVLQLNAGTLSSYPSTGAEWYDLSGESNDVRLNNGPSLGDGGWINFDGADDYGKISNTTMVPGNINSLTVGGVWKKNGDGANYETVLHQSTDTTIGNSAYWFGADSNDKITVTIGARNGVGWAAGQTTIDATLGKWFYTAAVWNGSTVYVYVNGELIKTYSLTTYTSPSTATRIAASGDATGYLANVGVSSIHINPNHAFSHSEILQNYYQSPIVTDGLVAALDFGNLISYENGSSNGYSLTGSAGFDLFNSPSDTTSFGGGITCQETDEFIALDDKIATDFVTVEVWYTRDSNGSGEDIVFNKESSWEIKDNGGNISWALMANNKSWFWHDSTANIGVGETIQFVLSYDGTYVKSYKNGELVQTYTYPSDGVLSSQTSCYPKLNSRGCTRTTVQNPGNHTLYQFRIYDRALTDKEVSQNYNANVNKFN